MHADTGATLGRPRWPCAGRALADPGSAARGPAGADAAAPLGSALLRAAQARAPPPRRSRRARGTLATPRGGAAELGTSLAPASARPEGPGTPRERRHPGSGLLRATFLPPGLGEWAPVCKGGTYAYECKSKLLFHNLVGPCA